MNHLMKTQSKILTFKNLIYGLTLTTLIPTIAHADAIKDFFDGMNTWIVSSIGPGIILFGIIIIGMNMVGQVNPIGITRGTYTAIGGFIILAASSIYNIFTGFIN